MKGLLALAALLLLPGSAAQESFHIPPEGPTTAALWMHMENDGTPLRGGNDQTTIGYMNVRRPLESSILVGRSLGPADCHAPSVLPTSHWPTWQVGISPDRIPLPSDQNYNHYHWNEATMDFTLLRGLDLIWYASIARTGPTGELLPLTAPVEAVLQADLVIAHTDMDTHEAVVDQAIASGRSDPVLLAGPPVGNAQSIEVDGFTAYKFQFRLNLTDGEVRSWPRSSMQLWLTLNVTSPPCGTGNVALAPASPFAATDPSTGDSGLSVLFAITEDPIRIDRVEVHADRNGGHFTALIRSPWGEADVDHGIHAQVDGVVLDDLLVLESNPAEHEDFHPLFNGIHTWHWKANATGTGVFNLIASTSTGAARFEVYVPFQVPANGVVHCVMEPPASAAAPRKRSRPKCRPLRLALSS